MTNPTPRRNLPLWILTGLLALIFVMTGSSKVGSVPPSPANFARWGFSPAFMFLIGAVEIVGAVGLLFRRTAFLASLLLIATMIGALKTGIAYHEALHIILPSVLLILLGAVAYMRRPNA